ncbi:PREDICTED: uncharacterized protein LOC104612635 [Nelumbo nucifera]|uniref:Uncharacterized protein LOC104612635 n=1 Tax=Nelumbo nucifera TaxID=4432 RepID=A0A1U8QBD5_NELNU|nr:PREDICTED: uncharacterized protein LOC104612635 [Nelumbo nucifera]
MDSSGASSNVHDHGTPVDEQKKRFRCNYCAKVVSGSTRLKQHLAGVRGDVVPCEQVPEDVKVQMRSCFLDTKKGVLTREVGQLYHPDLPLKRNWCSNSANPNHSQPGSKGKGKRVILNSALDECVERKVPNKIFHSSTGIKSDEGEEDSLRHAQRCIGRFFYDAGLDFNAVKSPSFWKMIDAIIGCGLMEYKIPSCQELKGWILEEEVKEIHQYVREVRHSWGMTGCSILLDGWTDGNGQNLINFLVDCPQGPIFLRSVKIMGSFDDADALLSVLDEIIEEVGAENVVQVIAHTTSGCMETLGKQFMEKHRTIFWSVCASHCIDLMLEKIGMMDSIKRVLDRAKAITKFIYGHSTVFELMKKHTSGEDLLKPSRYKSAMQFLTLENIVSKRENLRNMFASSAWNTSVWASSTEGKCVADLVGEPSFWSGAQMVLKAAIPLVRVLCLINGRDHRPQMGYIYETMDQMKETIKTEFKDKKTKYLPFWGLIDDIWDNFLHSPLHSAGYFLNPSLFYSSDFLADAEVASGLLCCIVRMVKDRQVQDLISLQLDEYRAANGSFGHGSAIDQRTRMPPAQWWASYGGHCPDLQRFAIRILSQTCCGASRYALQRNLSEQLHANGRNCIEHKRLNDLTFVHYNLRLQHFSLDMIGNGSNIVQEEIDAINDWVVDEVQDVMAQSEDSCAVDLDCGMGIAQRVISEEGPSDLQPKKEPR